MLHLALMCRERGRRAAKAAPFPMSSDRLHVSSSSFRPHKREISCRFPLIASCAVWSLMIAVAFVEQHSNAMFRIRCGDRIEAHRPISAAGGSLQWQLGLSTRYCARLAHLDDRF
jgi:hypothetical protein